MMNVSKQIEGNPSNAVAALIFFVLVGWFSSGLLSGSLAAIVPSWRAILLDHQPQTADFMRMIVGVNLPIMFLLPALYVAGRYRPGQVGSLLMVNRRVGFAPLAIVIVLLMVSQPALNLIGEWNKQLSLPDFMSGLMHWIKQSEAEAETMSKLMLETTSVSTLLLNILIVGIIPGICEEVMFRGVLMPVLADWFKQNHVAVWVTAFIFSFIHLQFLGFVPRLLLGAMLGYFVLYSGSLWTSIIAHSLNNTLIIVLTWFQSKGALGHDIDSLGFGKTVWVGWLSFVLIASFFYYLLRRKQPLK